MQQIFNTTRGLWEIALDNGVILYHSSLSVLNPKAANGFIVFTRVGHTNDYCAYEAATGWEYPVVIDVQCGGYFSFIADTRYILIGVSFKQGKHSGPGELCVMVFDTQVKAWLDFAAQPTLNVFHPIGSQARTRCLWIKNANQSTFTSNDPAGVVIDHKFLSANTIQWVQRKLDFTGYETLKRDINMGALGAIANARPFVPSIFMNPTNPPAV